MIKINKFIVIFTICFVTVFTVTACSQKKETTHKIGIEVKCPPETGGETITTPEILL